LATESQWEYACRGGTTTAYATGDAAASLRGYANVCDRFAKAHKDRIPYDTARWTFSADIDDGFATTSPVKSFKANALGVYDMHGNVWEWCADFYGEYPEQGAADPAGPARFVSVDELGPDEIRVLRGGSWDADAASARCAGRAGYAPDYRTAILGFRPSRTVGP
jgi:formylglycine-generating enzyme required for sulfatase activity